MTQDQVEHFMEGGATFYIDGFTSKHSLDISMEFYKRGTIQKLNDKMVSSPGVFNNYISITADYVNNCQALNEGVLYKIQDGENLTKMDFRTIRAKYDYNIIFILIIEDTPVLIDSVNLDGSALLGCWGCPISILLTSEQCLNSSLFVLYGFPFSSSLRKLFRNYDDQVQIKNLVEGEHSINNTTTADWEELI